MVGTLVPGREQTSIHSKNGMAKRQRKSCGDLGWRPLIWSRISLKKTVSTASLAGLISISQLKKSHVDELREEVDDHLRTAYNYHQISGVESSSLEELTSGVGFHYGVVDHGARHLHPLKYCLGLAEAVIAAGASVFENSPVKIYRGY